MAVMTKSSPSVSNWTIDPKIPPMVAPENQYRWLRAVTKK